MMVRPEAKSTAQVGAEKKEALERLKAELARAFAAPELSYGALTAAEVIAQNRT
jgi:hypothetical protein